MARKKKIVPGTRKDTGALTPTQPASEDIERLSEGDVNKLPAHLDRRVKRAVLDRKIAKSASQPKAPKPSVTRDPKTGKATPRIPKTPVVERTADPVVKKFKGGQLVTVKPRKQKKQTPIPQPRPGQVGKLGGKPVRVTPENAKDVYEERRRTELPVAGREDMAPAGRPEVEGVVLPKKLRSSQNGRNLGGFARSHKEVKGVTHEALGHLQTMARHAPGTPEHHEAHEAFNVAHSTLGQISNSNFHKFMGMGRTIVTQHRNENMKKALEVHRQGVEGKLEEGRIAEQARGDRSGKGGN